MCIRLMTKEQSMAVLGLKVARLPSLIEDFRLCHYQSICRHLDVRWFNSCDPGLPTSSNAVASVHIV